MDGSSSHFGKTKPMIRTAVTSVKMKIRCATRNCLRLDATWSASGRHDDRRLPPLHGQNENCCMDGNLVDIEEGHR